MTTIITRLYQDENTANGVAQTLLENHFRQRMLDVIAGGDAHVQMARAGVPKDAMDGYAQGIQNGNALLIVRAPFGGAKAATKLVDQTSSLAGTSAYVSAEMPPQNILPDHPRFLSHDPSPGEARGRPFLATLFGKPLLKKQVNLDNSLYRGTKFWANWPLPHLVSDQKDR